MRFVLTTLAIVLTLTGCGGPEDSQNDEPRDSQHHEFLGIARSLEPNLNYVTDETLIGLGTAMCQAMDEGVPQSIVVRTAVESGMDIDATAAAMSSAIVVYCPEHDIYN